MSVINNVFFFISNQVMKPMLERKRRARINRCLDELKELMSAALAADGENLTKLEKADVLELTVRHLHQLHRDGELSLSGSGLLSAGAISRSSFHNASLSTVPPTPMDRRRYQGGFLACAQQVASYVMKTPGLEPGLGQRLLAHLARSAQQLSSAADAPPQQQPGQQSAQLCLPEPPLLRMTPAAAAATNSTLVVDGAQLQTPARLANNRQYAVTAQLQFSYIRPEQQQRLPETSAGAEYRDKMPPNKRYAHFTFPVLPAECSAGAPSSAAGRHLNYITLHNQNFKLMI